MPLAARSMTLRNFQRAAEDAPGAPLATAQMVFTTGAPVKRYDWMRDRYYMEELVVEESAIRLDRMRAGAPLLNSHMSYSLEYHVGVVENPVIANGVGDCDVTFSRRESVAGIVQDVADRIIRACSVGYVRHRIEAIAPDEEGGMWRYRVVDWEPYEVSLVSMPADPGAQIRSDGEQDANPPKEIQTRMFPCEFIEVRATPARPTAGNSAATPTTKEVPMADENATGGGNAPAINNTAADQARQAAVAAEQQRAAGITDVCQRHNVAHLAADMIRNNQTVDQARAAVLDELARRDAAGGGHRNVGDIRTVTDEVETRMAGISEAIMHRMSPAVKLTENGRQYRGLSLLEMGREHLERCNVRTRGLSKMELATQIMVHRSGLSHTTSDFSSLLANVANKRLRMAYEENAGTYAMWARRAPNAPDFKSMSVVQLAGAPDLLRTNEHGEFKYGAMTDGAETYGLLTYGRIVSLSRQAMVNDDLRGFDRLVTAFGSSARRLENRTVYSQLTANANMADGGALFNATVTTTAGGHANLATGGGSVLADTALKAARTAMRVQKGLQREELNIVPAFLIVPAALEQTAYQLTSSNYVPATTAAINEFRQGGRTALEPVIEPVLDANSATAWYLAANNSQVDTVEYCYLDGAEGPVIESEMGFEIDGMSWKGRLDFAAKAVDFRGLYKAAGA